MQFSSFRKQGIKTVLLFYLLCSPFMYIQAQLNFNNPGWNATPPQINFTPPGWANCLGSADLQPGAFGVSTAPFEGTSYGAMHTPGVNGLTGEFISGQLSNPALAGQTYQFTFQLTVARLNGLTGVPIWVANNLGNNPGFIEIWGATNSCDQTELLWSGPVIQPGTGWNTMNVTITPSNNYDYLTFVPKRALNGTGAVYFGLDAISPVTVASPVPTLSQWGLILLGLIVAVCGSVAVFRRKWEGVLEG